MEGNDWQPNAEDEHKERNPKMGGRTVRIRGF